MSADAVSNGPRIAGAPISWGVCEAPGWGAQLDASTVLAELRAAGYEATEAGPDEYLSMRADDARAQLLEHELELAGAFVPVSLHDRAAHERSVAALDAALDRLAEFPGAIACLAVLGARTDYGAREELDADGWASTLAGLDDLAARAVARGVTCAVHPHVGTVVEQREDVDRVLDGCGIALCLDTGHLLLGGVDPLELARSASDRIVHVHLKDVDIERAARWRDGESPSYHVSVAEGMYVALGDGDARVGDVVDELVRRGYGGWLVLERDTVLRDEEINGRSAPTERIAIAEADRRWVEARIA